MWGDVVHLLDIIIGGVLFLVTGFGISIGYHRLFTHRSFVPKRWLKIVLASIGSLAMEGSLSGWVAAHRRHHVFSDAPGDPHSPHAMDRASAVSSAASRTRTSAGCSPPISRRPSSTRPICSATTTPR